MHRVTTTGLTKLDLPLDLPLDVIFGLSLDIPVCRHGHLT